MTTLVLTAKDLRKLVAASSLDGLLDRIIRRLGEGLEAAHAGGFSALQRSGFCYGGPDQGLLEWMPGRDDRSTTVKLVGYHPRNPEQAIPTVLSVIAAFENSTGHVEAIADATFLTALRTGAASALATDVLSDPASRTLGLIGCGAQAVTQLHAISRVRGLERVLLFDTDKRVEASFAQRVAPLGLGVKIERAPLPELLAASDILCTCTSVAPQDGPVFPDSERRSGLHINAIGSDFPGKTELPASILEEAFVCADFPEQCLLEGECQRFDASMIDCDLAKLWCDSAAFEVERSRLTVFDSTGWALEDHYALEVLVAEAARLGVGEHVEIEASALDPHNPYGFLELDQSEPADSKAPALERLAR